MFSPADPIPNPPLSPHLESLERQLLTPATRQNPEALHSLLAEDFMEFGASGRIYTRPQILAALAAEASTPPQITLTGFQLQQLAPDLALATYRTNPPAQSLRSSLWVLRDHRWQILFHQGTPIPPATTPGAPGLDSETWVPPQR